MEKLMENASNKFPSTNYDASIFHPILMHFAARFANRTYSEFASDNKILVDSNLKCIDYFEHDAVMLISDPYRETSAFGAKIEFPEDAVPICREKIVRTKDDALNLKNPDVFKSERTLDRIKGAELYKKTIGGNTDIIGWIEGPLAETCDLAGVNEILLNIALEPDMVKILMEKCMVTAKDFAKAQIDAGCNIMGVGDAICSQISPEMYADMVLPLHQELFDFIHNAGAKVKLHICGNISNHLPFIANSGADIVDLDWMVDMENARGIFGENITICGNLDPVSVIQNMKPEEIFDLSSKLVKKENLRPFILSGGCEITVNTPHQNLKAMREASIGTKI